MSGEEERAQAIRDALVAIRDARAQSTHQGINALLDAGWIPPRQHNTELAAIASWQRDARRAFAAVERIADGLEGSLADSLTGVVRELRDALGQQFRTPRVES